MDLSDIMKGVGALEAKLNAYAEKAEQEIKAAGSVSVETKGAIAALGTQQRESRSREVVSDYDMHGMKSPGV